MSHHPSTRASARHRRAQGVTFIELAVVMVILVSVGYLALPMLRASSNERLKGAARTLAADIEATRIDCIVHVETPHVIIFDIPGNRYYVAKKSDTATPVIFQMDQNPYEMRFGFGRVSHLAGVKLVSYSLDGDDQLGFGKYGELDQTGAAAVTLECEGSSIVVTIDSATGETTLGDLF